MGLPKLTPRQQAFVNEYLVDLNATQAAIRAGYSEKTAREQGARLLSKVNVQAKLQERQKARELRTEITQDMVLRELASIGFARGTDYAVIAQGGVVELTLTDDLTEPQKAAVTAIKETKDGVEIKLADKVKALELLGRHLGMFSERVVQITEDAPTNQLKGILEQLKNE